MKKIILLTLIISSLGVNAQSLLPIKYGIKVGVNIANISSIPNDGVKNIDNTALIGVNGGFYMEIALNDKWYINPELIYTQKGASFTYEYTHDYEVDQRDVHNTTNELKLAYIELNPTISYKASDKLSLNFGPSVSFLITPDYIVLTDKGGNDDLSSHEELSEGTFKEEALDVGLNIGISYYLTENFLIDGKVNTGFMKIGEVSKETYTGTTSNEARSNVFELKNRAIVISFAYLF
jgi:long-subunit fatty acid transport protein